MATTRADGRALGTFSNLSICLSDGRRRWQQWGRYLPTARQACEGWPTSRISTPAVPLRPCGTCVPVHNRVRSPYQIIMHDI
eukprot:scaffold205137_cov40-Prasinocladus_malaysianus.AAC.1